MSCGCGTAGGQVVLLGVNGVDVGGSGTATDPYVVSSDGAAPVVQIEVRDSATVNLTKFGSGTAADPYVLQADTSSASTLRGLGDVASSPSVAQGTVPMWIGSVATGSFQHRTPGTRYTTNAARGNGLYTGEVIRETDTGKRFEWDGSQWVDLTPSSQSITLDPSVPQSGGTLPTSTDWNTLTTASRIYRIGGWDANKNTPPGAYNFGTLEFIVSGLSVTHRYNAHNSTATTFVRTKWNASDWVDWRRLGTGDEVVALQGRATSLETRTTNLESNSGLTAQTAAVNYGSNVGINKGVDLTKVAGIVTFRFNLMINGGKSTTDGLVQLPDGFRPRSFSADCFGHNGNDIWGMAIDTDGWLRLRTHDIGGGGLWGWVSFQAA